MGMPINLAGLLIGYEIGDIIWASYFLLRRENDDNIIKIGPLAYYVCKKLDERKLKSSKRTDVYHKK